MPNKRLEDLLHYGRHSETCPTCFDSMYKPKPICNCGFDEAIEAAKNKQSVTTQSDECRKAFNEWCKTKGYAVNYQGYSWEAWQSSRESYKAELVGLLEAKWKPSGIGVGSPLVRLDEVLEIIRNGGKV